MTTETSSWFPLTAIVEGRLITDAGSARLVENCTGSGCS